MKKQLTRFQPQGNGKAFSSPYGQNLTSFTSNQSTQSFHTARYKGNKPGHDAGLGDSPNPSGGTNQNGFSG